MAYKSDKDHFIESRKECQSDISIEDCDLSHVMKCIIFTVDTMGYKQSTIERRIITLTSKIFPDIFRTEDPDTLNQFHDLMIGMKNQL